MIKISDYSLNYSALLSKGEMTLFDFLNRCRDLQSRLLTWSDRIAPRAGKPSGSRTSNG